jgi:transcriptional regulator with XRE-family HTH domain
MAKRSPPDGGLGDRLKRFRAAAGMTQAEVARAADVSGAYLSELEAGHGRRPSGKVLLRIAEALDVTIAELLGRDIAPAAEPTMSASLRAFIKEHRLDPADARMLASIRFRGEPPRTARRWAMIYDAIVASRSFDDA